MRASVAWQAVDVLHRSDNTDWLHLLMSSPIVKYAADYACHVHCSDLVLAPLIRQSHFSPHFRDHLYCVTRAT